MRSRRQSTIDFFSDGPDTDNIDDNVNIESQHLDNGGLDNPTICQNLLETLQTFGSDSLNQYAGCNSKYILLGQNNSLVQAEGPTCFTNLLPVFCRYEIDDQPSSPYSNTFLKFIVQTISRCLEV